MKNYRVQCSVCGMSWPADGLVRPDGSQTMKQTMISLGYCPVCLGLLKTCEEAPVPEIQHAFVKINRFDPEIAAA